MINSFDELKLHEGHEIACVVYGPEANIALECVDCSEILVDYDNTPPKPEPGEAVQERIKQIDELLSPGVTLKTENNRFCGSCGCLFLLDFDGADYLWVDRFLPQGDPNHAHCPCHDLKHVDNGREFVIFDEGKELVEFDQKVLREGR